MFTTFLFRSALEEGLYCKPKYIGQISKIYMYISVILAFVVYFYKMRHISILASVFCKRIKMAKKKKGKMKKEKKRKEQRRNGWVGKKGGEACTCSGNRLKKQKNNKKKKRNK